MYLFCMALLLVATAAWAAPRSPSDYFSPQTAVQRGLPVREMRRSLDEDSLHGYDVVKIESHLRFYFASSMVSGYAGYEITTRGSALSRIDMRLTDPPIVDSVWAESGYEVSHTRLGTDSIQVYLAPALEVGDTVFLGIAYHGTTPPVDGWGGFHWAAATSWQPQIGYSMGDGLNTDPPPANYNWLPSYADPTDKTLWEAWLTAPAGQTVTASGIRIDTVQNADSSVTWHYRLNQPVSTYLIAAAVSDYVIMVQRESGPRIENFVYPSRAAVAETHFSNVPAVLDGFVRLFGPYPFDRFGYAMCRDGDMEHATCVFHYDGFVQANHSADSYLIHELSHQWWGDWVTCGDWRDLWLNEGFGTYCEALGMEILYGDSAYHAYMTNTLLIPALGAGDSYSLYDPDYYWGATVYKKGACVMHMLRELLGDSAFFSAWREYGQEHAFGNAVTSEWQAKLEQHYGGSLDWFFQPWVYGTRFPRYRVTLTLGDSTVLHIAQTQTTATRFRMPLDIRIRSAMGDSLTFTIWDEAVAEQDTVLAGLTFVPSTLEADPNHKILRAVVTEILSADAETPALPREFNVTAVYPNPFNPSATVRFDLPKSASCKFSVFDLLGREVESRDLGPLSAGHHEVQWNGAMAPSGIYWFRLQIGADARTAKAVLLK
jgi:aminopeptidase N